LFPELTEKELDEHADKQLDILLSFAEKSWAGSLFVDKETIGNANTAIINTSHPFYVKFYQKISEIDDPELRNSLTILILSFIEAENELELTIDNGHILFEQIRENWGQKLKAWLPEA
jgi:hypothetical protein